MREDEAMTRIAYVRVATVDQNFDSSGMRWRVGGGWGAECLEREERFMGA